MKFLLTAVDLQHVVPKAELPTSADITSSSLQFTRIGWYTHLCVLKIISENQAGIH